MNFCVNFTQKFAKFHFKNAKTKAKIQGFAKKPEFSVKLNQRCSISSEKSLLANEARLKTKCLPKFVKSDL